MIKLIERKLYSGNLIKEITTWAVFLKKKILGTVHEMDKGGTVRIGAENLKKKHDDV